jgi:hypothetical protein
MVEQPAAIDFFLQLTSDRKFTTQQEMQVWVCAEAEKFICIVMVAKSDNRNNGRIVFGIWSVFHNKFKI